MHLTYLEIASKRINLLLRADSKRFEITVKYFFYHLPITVIYYNTLLYLANSLTRHMGVFSLVLAKVAAGCALLPLVVFSGRTVVVTFATSTTGSFVPVADAAPEGTLVAVCCCFSVTLTPPPCADTTGVGPALMDTKTPEEK